MSRPLFYAICAFKRVASVLFFFPMGLLLMPYRILRRQSDLHGFISLFSVREWNLVIGDGPEIATSRYWVIETKYPTKLDRLPPDCWYHPATKKIACRSIDEAVLIRLKYDGKIQRK